MVLRLRDCVVLHASDLPACAARIDKRFVGYSSLQWVTRGAVELWYNARRHDLAAGMVWPCNPGPRIRFHAAAGTRDWHHRHIAVRGPLLDHWRAEGLWPDEPQPAPDDDGFADAFTAMTALARDPARQARAVNLLEQVLLRLAEARRAPVAEPWVERAKRMLAAEGFGDGVAAVAEACGMAESSFRRAFRRAVGVAPRDFAITARLERARELLLAGDRPIAAIAEQLGYREVFFFSRQFRAHTGMSPRAYRQTRV